MKRLWLVWSLPVELVSLAMLPLVQERVRPSLPTGSGRRA
jgi:hypothetical protein